MSNTGHENQKSLPIGIKNLSKSYGDVYALEDVSLDIKAGELLTSSNVRSIRPGLGLSPRHLSEVLGKIASKNIERGTPLSLDMIR